MKEKILAREKECFEFLKAIPIGKKFVLIGGMQYPDLVFQDYQLIWILLYPRMNLISLRIYVKNTISFTLRKKPILTRSMLANSFDILKKVICQ